MQLKALNWSAVHRLNHLYLGPLSISQPSPVDNRGKWSNLAQPNADNKKIPKKFIVTDFLILIKFPTC